MTVRQLSQEIVSLIHHVELNESGWWKKANAQVVQGIIWRANTPLSPADLRDAIKREIGVNMPIEAVTRIIDSLSSQNVVTWLPDRKIKLTEKTYNELKVSLDAALSEQETCRTTFLASCTQECPELDPERIYIEFRKALAHVIQVTGANLFHLLTDGNLERDGDWLDSFFSKFDSSFKEPLQRVIAYFFNVSNRPCRNQVFRLLSAHFFAEATQLSQETLSLLESKKTRLLRIVLDTNFVFSVLKLHDNPGDDAALSLVDLAHRSNGALTIRLFVLPDTLEELRRTLQAQMNVVENIRTTRAMAGAARTQPLSGIVKRFFEAASKSPGLTAESFFQPYIDELRTILREKGIEVLDAPASVYHQRQDIVDDVLAEKEREERDRPIEMRKGYEAIQHDVVLWHAVKDRRNTNNDSPFDAEYWAVSIDWRLIAFDRQKRAALGYSLPVVIHPSNLIQLIQFWLPRSDVLQESLVDSLRLPLFFHRFDPEDEKTTVRVLAAISRFENIDDFSEGTIETLLANRALRGKLKEAEKTDDEVLQLVKDEILAQHKEALGELERTKRRLSSSESSLADAAAEQEDAKRKLEITAASAENASRVAEAERERANKAETERMRLDQERQKQLEILRADIASEKETKERWIYSSLFILAPLVAGGFFGIWVRGNLQEMALKNIGYAEIINSNNIQWIAFGALLIPFLGVATFSRMYTAKRAALSCWWVSRIVSWIGWLLGSLIMLAGLAIYQGGVWDVAKAALGIKL